MFIPLWLLIPLVILGILPWLAVLLAFLVCSDKDDATRPPITRWRRAPD